MQLAILQTVPLHVTGSCLSRGSKEVESVNLCLYTACYTSVCPIACDL